MSITYHVLYSDLLEDLREWLPYDVVDEESAASAEYHPWMTLKQFQALSLAKSFFKKFEERSTKKANENALNSFHNANVACGNWSLRMESLEDEMLVGLFKQEIYRFFHPYGDPLFDSFNEILQFSRTGPGASLGAVGNDFYSKLFSSPLTCTSKGLHIAYEHYYQSVPYWAEAEKLRFAEYGDAEVVAGNRLDFVPKNQDTSRVTCTEPNLNMYFQLGLGNIIAARLKSFFGIDLSVQPDYNRELARIGSEQDSYVTIDLSQASDSVSLKMVRELFPPNIVMWLEKFRSPTTTLPNGEVMELNMISSMGNGYTFPLETAIFACALSAAYHMDSLRMVPPAVVFDGRKTYKQYHGNFGVFGDDIISEKGPHMKIVRLLKLLGFSVNAEKSFLEGRFRESCGGDYLDGHPTRGVYIKRLGSLASRFVAINRLNYWTAFTGIPLRRTVRYLKKRVRYLPVPFREEDDAGLRVPWDLVNKSKVEYDPQTHYSVKYRRWATDQKVLRITDSEIHKPRGAKGRIYNGPGLLAACLRGDVDNGTIGIRCGSPRYRTKWGIVPYWNYLPSVPGRPGIGWTRLATAVRINFS